MWCACGGAAAVVSLPFGVAKRLRNELHLGARAFHSGRADSDGGVACSNVIRSKHIEPSLSRLIDSDARTPRFRTNSDLPGVERLAICKPDSASKDRRSGESSAQLQVPPDAESTSMSSGVAQLSQSGPIMSNNRRQPRS